MGSLDLLGPANSERKLPATPIRALGIDLGTTNSTVAEVIWDPADPSKTIARCLEVEQPTLEGVYTHVLVPSAVAIYQDRLFVGEGAKRLRAKAPELGVYQGLFYECKNHMGIQRTYHKAPEGFRSAAEIGARVLSYLKESALADDPTPVSRVVVTVPASFQSAQRVDTQKAAELAGLEVQGGDLLDEPVAAFLDYLVTHRKELLPELTGQKTLVVFDFGGGTCDVALFRLEGASQSGGLKAAPLSVSRYHRLGGGDIDAAILYEVLLPQLLEQNNLLPFALTYKEKKEYVEPALLGVAEALKIGLSTEIARLQKFGRYQGADKSQIVKKLPGVRECDLRGRRLTLQSPQLTAEQFETLLEPFLDRDLLYARQTDYRMTCSIFAPLQDALERSSLDPADVDYCLLVGGSSLIPQVAEAAASFFASARVLTHGDADSVQTAVARGAAYHALALALHGKGLIQPCCHESIGIRTVTGSIELVPAGAALPYPADGSYRSCQRLLVPETVARGDLKLRVEIVAGEKARLLYGDVWTIPAPAAQGESLALEYRYDENQMLDLRMRLSSAAGSPSFARAIEKPLTNVVNPDVHWAAILDLEERLRTGEIPQPQQPAKFEELANHYVEIGHREKALDLFKAVLRTRNGADAGILNRMATLAGELGDVQSEEKFYREATRVSPWSGSWFNLALAQKRRGQIGAAVESLEKALAMEREAPFLVLRAMLADSLGDSQERVRFLNEALATFEPVGALNDWELGWFLTAARMDGDEDASDRAFAEMKRRRKKVDSSALDQDALLPMETVQEAQQ